MWDKAKEFWAKYKLLILIVVPLIILAKFRDIVIDILVSSARRLVEKSKKQGSQLQREEDAANQEANKIIADADKKSENKPSVDEDWNKK